MIIDEETGTMDAPPPSHPNDQTLMAYGLGRLDDALGDQINAHLEACLGCRTRLGRLSPARKATHRSATGAARAEETLGSLAPALTSGPPPADTLPPGLADHADYEIRRELGRGGMGVVYLAHNTMMGRDEVLKVISRHVIERPGVLDRFQREIRSVARLRHPNIVTAYTAFRLEGGLVFAMEYVEGLDLSKLVKAKGPLSVPHAAFFVHQAALGLQHAHEKGMIHRDIKPHNLMLGHDGKSRVVKILDFGLAKASREEKVDGGLTMEGQALGTPDYIAPEQILNAQSADIRADLYSLGGTLFYLLTGRPPFLASSLYDLYQSHISRDLEALNLLRPEVPSELAALVSKMMAKEVDQRFQIPVEVAQALAPYFKPRSVNPRSESRPGGRTEFPQSMSGEAARTMPPSSVVTPRVEAASKPAELADPLWERLIAIQETARPEGETEAIPTTPRARWFWPTVAASVLVAMFAIVGLAVGVLRVKTAEGMVVLENVPKDAEIRVDGDKIDFQWPGSGSPIEIRAVAGLRKLEIRKDGFWTFAKKISFKVEGAEKVQVTLEPLIPPTAVATTTETVVNPVPPEKPARKPPESAPSRPPVPSNSPPTPKPTSVDTAVGRKEFAPAIINGGRWEVMGDELTQSEATAQFPFLLFGDDQWTDYDFSVDFMKMRGPSDLSLVVRGLAINDHMRYAVSGRGGWNQCFIESVRPGGEPRLRNGGNYTIQSYVWYSALVKVRGNRIEGSLFDGGKRVSHVVYQEDNHPRGRVGFRTWYASYKIRNIQVKAPDGSKLWAGPPKLGSSKEVVSSRPAATTETWVSLFNGKDKTGWKVSSDQPGYWRVEDGLLKGSRSAISHLYTERGDYKNVHVRARVRVNDGGAGGIYVRSSFGPRRPEADPKFCDGYEAAVNSSNTNPNKTGSLYGPTGQTAVNVAESLVPPGRWMILEIITQGGKIVVKVDGKTTAEVNDSSQVGKLGHITLLQYRPETVIEFGKIEIRELP